MAISPQDGNLQSLSVGRVTAEALGISFLLFELSFCLYKYYIVCLSIVNKPILFLFRKIYSPLLGGAGPPPYPKKNTVGRIRTHVNQLRRLMPKSTRPRQQINYGIFTILTQRALYFSKTSCFPLLLTRVSVSKSLVISQSAKRTSF